jgi:hypothetical protein
MGARQPEKRYIAFMSAGGRNSGAMTPEAIADAPSNVDEVRRKLFFEELIAVREKGKKDGAHVVGRQRDKIAGLEPLDEFASGHGGRGFALIVNDGRTQVVKVPPEIVTRVLAQACVDDILPVSLGSRTPLAMAYWGRR